ncbi:MAG: NADH:ubiquinone oxidoreductase [Candidatus Latescibacteria bacterium]|nr:NADH:ubiquinone oxidoreductase [Candidatus Latescibacterota bacterium]
MSEDLQSSLQAICRARDNDRIHLLEIVRQVQARWGQVTDRAIEAIARHLEIHRVEVEGVVSFYAFVDKEPRGQVAIRLCDDIIDRFQGGREVAQVFAQELGIEVGQTTPDGRIGLEYTACIGMPDQAPAALIGDVVVTNLSTDRARQMARLLKAHGDPALLVDRLGDGNNGDDRIHAMVRNNIRRAGPVVLADMEPGVGIEHALAMNPAEVIRQVKTARLRGRGGAGFPTGMKWDFTRQAEGPRRCLICNADEGEPGTFKDRVILTERPDLLFEGMAIGAWAIGADTGILYLRAEYAYLRQFLEDVLAQRRGQGLLGKAIGGREGFNFDIRIQMGAGAYICGEETALISSCEGLRGEPKTRPPFPAQEGYLGMPTAVNNVETFCCVARILEKGPAWFARLGSKGSAGTKLLSVSGDCKSPGVYEVPFGTTLAQVLDMADARDVAAVQVGGPSGSMVGPDQFERAICYDDLATGGSIMVFGPQRDLLEVVTAFAAFFEDESCGYCTPCRVGNVLLRQGVEKIAGGQGTVADLDSLQALGQTVKATSRCGLGQTSPNPVLTTLENFRSVYEARLQTPPEGRQSDFDLAAAVAQAARLAARPPNTSHQ